MKKDTSIIVVVLTLSLVFVGVTGAIAQPASGKRISAAVTYVTPGTVYINAGTGSGLATGDTLTVLHAATPVGRVVISAVSTTSSAATPVGAPFAATIGDTVYVMKSVESLPPPVPVRAAARSTERRPAPTENIVTGRVAVQYAGAGVFASAMDFSQPAVLLRLGIDRLFGTDLTFTMYGRTYYDLSDQFKLYGQGSRLSTRVYEMSLTYDRPQASYGYTLGRLISPFLGGLGQFDGGQVFVRSGGLSAGLAAGTQADPRTSAVTLDYQKGAVFANYAWGGDVFTRSDATIAYGQQLYKGKFDRDFLYTQASIRPTPTLSFYESSEFDVHDLVDGSRVSRLHLTSAFATLSYAPAQWVTLNAGYDATRVIYLFESMKAFPDSLINRELQRGVRGGFTLRLPLRAMFMGSATFRPTDGAKNAHTINTTLRVADIASSGVNAGLLYTTTLGLYTNGTGFAFDLDRWIGTAVVVGGRLDRYWYTIKAGDVHLSTTTLTVNTNARLSQQLYLLINYDQIWDTLRKSQRIYFEFGVRF